MAMSRAGAPPVVDPSFAMRLGLAARNVLAALFVLSLALQARDALPRSPLALAESIGLVSTYTTSYGGADGENLGCEETIVWAPALWARWLGRRLQGDDPGAP